MIGILLLLASNAAAQEPVARGAKIFAQSCAVGYCHGSGGAANRGPRLAGRSFDKAYLRKVIADGLPGTAMPGFKTSLKDDGVDAVSLYVMSLAGGAPSAVPAFQPSAEPPKFDGPPIARKGKDLFFDAVRGTRCGTCHHVDDWGVAVGPNLAAKPPVNGAAIRDAKTPSVRAASTTSGESLIALVLEQNKNAIRVFDLTTPPPVMRTFEPGQIRFTGPAAWSHASAVRSYSPSDLDAIAAYLGWLSKR